MVFGNSPVADIKKYSPKQISVNPKPGKSKSFIGKTALTPDTAS
jgi:tRNA (Thr-GGU) A37 N-methylase